MNPLLSGADIPGTDEQIGAAGRNELAVMAETALLMRTTLFRRRVGSLRNAEDRANRSPPTVSKRELSGLNATERTRATSAAGLVVERRSQQEPSRDTPESPSASALPVAIRRPFGEKATLSARGSWSVATVAPVPVSQMSTWLPSAPATRRPSAESGIDNLGRRAEAPHRVPTRGVEQASTTLSGDECE
jgi:hypothetical protein